MKSKVFVRAVLCTSFIAFLAGPVSRSQAALIAYEGFDITEGENALNGASGLTSSGWSGNWGAINNDVIAGLSYGGLQTIGGAALVDVNSAHYRSLSSPPTSGSVWISVLGRIQDPTVGYAGLSFFDAGAERLFIGRAGASTNWGVQVYGGGSTAVANFSSTNLCFVVVRVDFNASGANEQFFIWFNPALGSQPADGAALRPGSDTDHPNGYTRVRLNQATSVDNAIFDEIRVGTTWADVAPTCPSSSTIRWQNNAGGLFSTAANWLELAVPSACDVVLFTNAASYAVTFDQAHNNQEVRFNASGGEVSVNLGGYAWNISDVMYDGYSAPGNAAVVISNGVLNTFRLQLGAVGSSGALTLRNVSNLVTYSGGLAVGLTGTGRLTLAESGTRMDLLSGNHILGNSAGSRGDLVASNGFLRNSGSWILGNSGYGALGLFNATGVVSEVLTVGSASGSTGVLYLADDRALFVASNRVLVGSSAGSSGHIVISNGLAILQTNVWVGSNGWGGLTVERGTNLIAGNLMVGVASGSIGRVNLGDEGSLLVVSNGLTAGFSSGSLGAFAVTNGRVVAKSFSVGRSGEGSFALAGASTRFDVSGNSYIGENAGASGSVFISGGTMNVTGVVYVGHNGFGSLTVQDGTNLNTTTFLGNNASSRGVMRLSGVGAYASGGINMGNAAGAEGELYLNGGLYYAPGETKLCINGRSLIVLDGGSYSNNGGNSYLPHYTGTGTLVVASPQSTFYLGGWLSIGRLSNGVGNIYLSNGMFNVDSLDLPEKSNSVASMFVYNATAIVRSTSSGPFDIAQDGASTGLVVVADERGLIFAPGNNMNVGRGGNGTLIISNGTVNVKGMTIGGVAGAVGLVVVEAGSLIIPTNVLAVGANAPGTLILAHPDAYLEQGYDNGLTLGSALGVNGSFYLSNGTARVRQLLVGGSGSGYVWIGPGSLTVGHVLYIPNSSASAYGTGLMVVASTEAMVVVTQQTTRVGSGTLADCSGALVVSNGTVWLANTEVGSASDGSLHIGAATVTVVSTGGSGIKIGQGTGAGRVVLADSAAVLDLPGAELWVGGTGVNGSGTLIVSNGQVNAGFLHVGRANGSKGRLEIHDGSMVILTNAFIGNNANTTSLVLLAHANSQLTVSNGGLYVGVYTNSFAQLILSNGSVVAKGLDVGSAGGTQMVAELWIHNATSRLLESVATANAMSIGGRQGATGTVVLAHAGARVEAPLGGRLYIGNSGHGRLIISNGVYEIAGALTAADSQPGLAEITVGAGRLTVGGQLTLGRFSTGILTVAHADAVVEVGSGGLWMGDANGASAGGRSILYLSNGTVRSTVPLNDHLIGGGVGGTVATRATIEVSGGLLDFQNGNLFLGNRTAMHGELLISGGTVLVNRLRLPAGDSDQSSTGTVQLSGGVLYLGGLESAGKSVNSRSNVWLSGGTIRELANFTTSLNMELLTSPGPGVLTFDIQTNVVQLAGVLSGPGGLRKTGAGTLMLHAVNTYAGGTVVSSGVLAVQNRSGAGTGSGAVSLRTGGVLAGTGSVSTVSLGGGVLNPGYQANYVGSLLAGTMVWTSGVYRWEVQDFATTNWDSLISTGALTFASGVITVQVATLSSPGQAGSAENYDLSQGYTAILASATSFIDFDEDKFAFDLSAFQNELGATWSVATQTTNLLLICTPSGSGSRRMYWDPNGTAGTQNGNGEWSTSSNAWLVGGAGINMAWDNTTLDRAIFMGGTGAQTWTATVTEVSVTNIGINLLTGNSTYKIDGPGEVVMVGLGQSFNIESVSARLNLSAPLRIPSGRIVKAGPGELQLSNPYSDVQDGVLVKQGKLVVGSGGTAGELGGGLVTLLDGGAEIIFNRSSYTITNSIAGGRTYFTNNGGGYAWAAGATQDFAVLYNNLVVTQQSSALVFTNYVQLDPLNNTAGSKMLLRGGSLYAPTFTVGGNSHSATSQLVVAENGFLMANTLNVGNANFENAAGEVLVSNGIAVVSNQIWIGKSGATLTKSTLWVDGGLLRMGAGSWLTYPNGQWVQTGGSYTSPTQSAGNNMSGYMELRGGSYYQGGDFISVGGAGLGQSATMIITNDAELRLVAGSTNFSRTTYLAVGGNASAFTKGEVLVAGGSLIMTNSLGRFAPGGTVRSNNGDIVLGINNRNSGTLRIQGGRVHVYQVWLGGHNFQSVSGGGFGNAIVYGSTNFLYVSGGELYTMRGFSQYGTVNPVHEPCTSNIYLSGGTIGALGEWLTTLNITLTNSPGPGLTRFDPNGNLMTLAGVLSGPGGLSMDGAGVLVISNNNSTLGGVNYSSNGVLRIMNTAGLALGTNLLVTTGSGAVCGTGFLRDLLVTSGGTLSAGECTNVGSLTTADVTLSNTVYRWDILDFNGAYGTGWDRLNSTGTLTLAAGSTTTVKLVTLSAPGSYGPAQNFDNGVTYTRYIASAVNISGFAGHTFVVDTSEFANDSIIASVQLVSATNLAVVIAPGLSGNNRALYWDADRFTAGLQNGTGLWNNAVANWRNTDGANQVWNNGRQDHAIFGGAAGSGSWTVNVSGISSATNIGMSFLSGGSSYTVAGTGYLSFVSSSVVTAAAPGTVDARLEGLGFTKLGPATLTLGGSNRFLGVLNVSNGAVRITNAWALGDTNGSTVVTSGAELQAAVSGSSTIRDALTISGSGTNGLGALRFTAGTPTWVGTVTVAGASARIGVDAGLTATLSTVVTGGVADVFAAGSGRLMLNGGVQLGSGKIVKDGTGVLSLRGPSAYSGGTIVSAGTLRVCGSCAANVAGTATIRLENNTVLGSETAASTIVNPLDIWGNVQLIDSTSPFNRDLTVTGAVALNSAVRTITVPSGVATLSGPISGGGLNKRGAGTLVLGGANTYGSPTIVSNGTLVMNGTNSNSAVTTVAGTTLIGSGSLAATTVNGTLDPGAQASAVGAISMASLNLRPSSSIRITITNATAVGGVDTINCVGTLTVSATAGGGECVIIPDTLGKTPVNFTNANSFSWKIIDAGALSGYENQKFSISASSFSPSMGGGYFVVTMSVGDLYLQFRPATNSNLKLTVTDTPDPVGLSNVVTYALTVTNMSPITSSLEMVLTNYLDSHIAYESSSAGGSHLGGGVVTWSLPELLGGGSTTVTLQARALIYGIYTNVAHVSTDLPEVIEDDNRATNVTQVMCVPGLAPVINPIGNRSVVVETPLTFSITAFDAGCYPPDLAASGLPAGASFSFTNNYPASPNTFGNFSWTPDADQAGMYPVRFIATDQEGNVTSAVIRIYVAGASESTNSAGIPVSQTNWHVAITNLETVGGSDVEVVWTSTNGIAYDVQTSVGTLGAGAVSWTKSVAGWVAEGNRSTTEVTSAEARRYFKVVLENEGVRDSNGVWAVFRPTIQPGFNLVSVPLYYTNLSFNGELGTILANALSGHNSSPADGVGDEVLILQANGVSYKRLYLDGGNPAYWRESGGALATDTLQPGQGFFILRNSGSTAQPVFTAPVGNLGNRTNTIVEGFNLLGLAEGWYNITFTRAFSSLASGSLNANWDEETADQLIQLNDNGSYSRFWRAPDGWRNAATDALATTNLFIPGRAYYYKRVIGSGQLKPKF